MVGGLSYPGSQLTEAWKKASFNQFHDVAAGTAIAAVYLDAQKDYDAIHWTANEATGNALKELDSHVTTDAHPGVPIIVWNTLNWKRSDVVKASVQMPHTHNHLLRADRPLRRFCGNLRRFPMRTRNLRGNNLGMLKLGTPES